MLESVADQLVVLARLHGVSVPAYRFSVEELQESSLEMSRLAFEAWHVRFPEGGREIVDESRIQKGSFPLLWIDDNSHKIKVVKSKLASKDYLVEEDGGVESVLRRTEAKSGQFYKFSTGYVEEHSESKPKSASQWFWYEIKSRRLVFTEAVGATFLMNILGLFTAMYTMQVYDRVIPTQGFSTLWVLTVGVGLSILFEFGMRQLRSIMTERAAKSIDLDLSGVFFSKALSIRMDARPPTVGTFASQIRHFESVRSFMTSAVLFVLADVPFAVLFIAVVGLIGGYLAVVPMITVPLAIMVSMLFRGRIERLTAEHMKESNEKNGLLIEAVDGIESIKATGSEWKIQNLYMSLTRSIASSELKLKLTSAKASHLSMLIQQGNYVALIAVGAYAISEGELSMGALIASSIIMGRIFNPLAQIPNLVVQWKHAQIALKSLDQIMSMPSDRGAGGRQVVPTQIHGEIKLDQVSFRYSEKAPIFNVSSLCFRPGEKVAIIGPVGSGKSTLLKLVSGLYAPQQGNVLLDGCDMQQISPDFMREKVGYLPQEVRLFNGSLRSNLTLGLPTPSDEKILSACESTGLISLMQSRPEGLELPISEGGRGLSGGQKQLVGLTRLLIMSPRIMLLDEPTASMDSELEIRVMNEIFKSQDSDALTIVVTHKKAVLSQVDRIVVVSGGSVAMDGPRDAVLAKIAEMSRAAKAPNSRPGEA